MNFWRNPANPGKGVSLYILYQMSYRSNTVSKVCEIIYMYLILNTISKVSDII